MSNVIEDRTVLEVGNVQYVACIVQDEYPSNPLKDWDQAVSFFVPAWEGERSNRNAVSNLNGEDIPFDYRVIWNQPQYLRDKTTEARWYERTQACDWLELMRRCDPSGLYFIVQWNDSGYGDTLKFADDDDESTHDYAIAYRTSAQIREDHMVKRITKEVRNRAESNIRADIKTQNAYFSGEVYRYIVIRHELDDDGEVIESEEIDAESYDAYGWEDAKELYEYAKKDAENDAYNREFHAQREREATASHAMQSMDLFDASSYPEPTMSDVAGAYEARLNEQFSELGRVTRKLTEEGYHRGHGIIAIG